MSYEEIMEQIKSGLTGNKPQDLRYLMEQVEKYKDHELGKEIEKECGRIMVPLLPREQLVEMAQAVEKDGLSIEVRLGEVHDAVVKKDFKKALAIVNELAEEADNNPMFQEDKVNVYFDFYETFEQMIYEQVNKPEKTVRRAEYPFAPIYLNQGSILVELGQAEEANAALAKAMKWNPVNMGIRSEYMETLKLLRRLDEYFEMCKESFKYAFRPADLARCYRNLGWYFIEKELYSAAIGVYILSIEYDKKSEGAQSEMFYIKEMDPEAKAPTHEEMKLFSETFGFPVGPSPEVLQTAMGYGKFFMEKGEREGARYCLEIVYDLTGSEEIKKLLERLS